LSAGAAAMRRTALIDDVQSSTDARQIAIDQVGIKGICYPITIRDGIGEQHTVATLSMNVNLAHDTKGTHMSRFIEILEADEDTLSIDSFGRLLEQTADYLGASTARIEMTFPYFIKKSAPVSGVESLMNYTASLFGERRNGKTDIWLKAAVPVTSLCPCSKKISNYGAHSQRSHITIAAKTAAPLWFEDLIRIAEAAASCELFGILKRPDEKYVTERAYDNPKFVEDIVRDVAVTLNQDIRVRSYVVESENFESIHNHSAYALIEFDKERP
jgi:GTP cyclohydrolase I